VPDYAANLIGDGSRVPIQSPTRSLPPVARAAFYPCHDGSGTDAKPGGRMSNETYDPNPPGENEAGDMNDPGEYGGLSVEDDPQGTVDPADVAGTADESDEDVS
jgi:hypothetical protein